MEFPHLDDTNYPHLNTENVWKYRNNFDYTRWGISTTLRLCSVNYPQDYSHVVDWKSAEERDNYFTNLDPSHATQLSEPTRLETMMRLDARVHTVKVPVPFDVASRFNYLQVTLAPATSSSTHLNFENDEGIRTWYFFIEEATYRAPSATELTLSLDMWTSYRPYINVEGYMLERGHAPVALAETPENFLSAPLYRADYLLANDVEVTDTGEVKQAKPLGYEGDRIYCFTLPYTPAQLQSLTPAPNTSAGYTDPEYYNTGERNGYQKGVRGYDWNVSGKNWNTAPVFSPTTLPINGNSNAGLFVYGVDAENAVTFLNTLRNNNLNILRDISAVFTVNKNWVTLSQSFTLYNTTLYHVEPNPLAGSLHEISFTVDDFNYPNEYKKFTKLYTSPYAKVTVCDNSGNSHELNVQDLTGESGLAVKAILSAGTFKTLASIVNVGASGGVTYEWTNLTGANVTGTLPLSDFDNYLLENDIPLYQINISALSTWELENFAHAQGARLNALASYKNSAASANNGYENTLQSADTDYTNSVNGANTSYTNAVNSANTGYTNAAASANTGYTNAAASANTAYNNVVRSNQATTDNTNLAVIMSAANQAYSNSYKTLTLTESINNDITATNNQNALQNNLTTITGTAKALTSLVNGITSVAGAVASGDPSNVLSAGIGMYGDMANTAVSIGADQAEASEMNQYRSASSASRHGASRRINTGQIEQADLLNENANITLKDQTRNSVNASNTNANNTRNTSIANADRSRDTSISNADRSRNTSITNAGNTRNTSNDNSARTRNTTRETAGYTRGTSIENAKRSFETAQEVFNYSGRAARVGKTQALTSASGDTTRQLLGLEGYTARLIVPQRDNVRRLGDYFARYGYASGEYFTGNDLQKMREFTYLKAIDVQLANCGADSGALAFMSDIMKEGLTVWSNPDKVNAVSIYDNWE